MEAQQLCPLSSNCRNYSAQCWACVWPEDQLAPTQYLPVDRHAKMPAIEAKRKERAAQRKAQRQSDAAKRGRANRRKGQRVERNFAKLTGGTRVPLSGALRGELSNDVALPNGLKVEVKARKDGWRELYRWVLDEVEKPDAVVLKADNRPWLVVQTYEQWAAGRQPVAVDWAKLAQARALLDEAIGERG